MKQIILLFFLFVLGNAFSQNANYKSIMQQQSEHYQALNLKTDEQFDSLRNIENNSTKTVSNEKLSSVNSSTCILNKKIFGWHPYWVGSTYTAYQWNLLSDLCYFSYDTDPTTGKLSQDTANFNYSPITKKLTITGGVDPLFLQLKDVTTDRKSVV